MGKFWTTAKGERIPFGKLADSHLANILLDGYRGEEVQREALSRFWPLPINGILCENCNDVLISYTVHDFKMCKCGKVAVDGGWNYLRRIGTKYHEFSDDFKLRKDKLNKFLKNIIDNENKTLSSGNI